MKTVIEHPSPILNAEDAETISKIAVEKGMYPAKIYCLIFYKNLCIGKGGSHIWFKARTDLDTRLAITYL